MLVVVNQPHINNFTIQGTISDKDLQFFKKHFGESLVIEDDEDLVGFRDTDWFKEIERGDYSCIQSCILPQAIEDDTD